MNRLSTNNIPRVHLAGGQALTLGPALSGATGEGTVFGVRERPDWAAKVFHHDLSGLQAKLEKVAAMIESPPGGAVQPDGFVVLTWPQHLILDRGVPVGYVMPRINTTTSVELHTMSNPSDRLDPMPTAPQWTKLAGWGHLVHVATNLCHAVEVVHRVDAVIGDFQERNILVSDTTQVTLVDCDSIQFTDRSGRQFLCAVGRPEFTAPELAGTNLRTQGRDKSSDLFALAVHIHQLLMAGNHPFLRGEWSGPAAQPDALTLARSGEWAGGPQSRLHTHALAPPVTFLPGQIQQYFVRAFTDGAHDPGARPSAAQWCAALSRIRPALCRNGIHQIPDGCPDCPWCAIDQKRAARAIRTPQRGFAAVTPGVYPAAMPPSQVVTPPPPRPSRIDALFAGVNTRTYLLGLSVVVLVVVALATFIVWAVLSGSTIVR